MTPEMLLRATAEAIRATHGCSCEKHPSIGVTAACQAWRQRAAEESAQEALAVILPAVAEHLRASMRSLTFIQCADAVETLLPEETRNWEDYTDEEGYG